MRPLTKEEYEELEFAKSDYEYNQLHTKVPPTISKIHRQRAEALTDIMLWLNSLGCKTTWNMYETREELLPRMLQNTAFEIKVRHDNDYVECGPGFDDPEGKLFKIITPVTLSAKFAPENLQAISQQLALFADHKLPQNKKMPHVNLNFFTCDRRRSLDMDSMDDYPKYEMKLRYSLSFEIFHTWK